MIAHTVGYFTNEAREEKWGLFGREFEKERIILLWYLSVEVGMGYKRWRFGKNKFEFYGCSNGLGFS